MRELEGPWYSQMNLGNELNNCTALVPKDPPITVLSPWVLLILSELLKRRPLLLVYLIVNFPGSSTSFLMILNVYRIMNLSLLLSQDIIPRALSLSQ